MAGLDPALSPNAAHYLLRPVEPRYFRYTDDAMSDEEAVDTLAQADRIAWSSLTLEEVTPARSDACFWEGIGLDASSPDGLASFVMRWGLPDYGERNEWGDLGTRGYAHVSEWPKWFEEARALLHLVLLTEQGEQAPDEVMLPLRDYDLHGDYWRPSEFWLPAEERQALEWVRQRTRWEQLRRAHRGMELQREIATVALANWFAPLSLGPLWDGAGSKVATEAHAVRGIIGAHLMAIFSAPTIDVFTCSVCYRLYPFDETVHIRRPKAGARRYCSEQCRSEGKRLSNLASWHRNKDKWSRKGNSNG